jgi:hypothetical protein
VVVISEMEMAVTVASHANTVVRVHEVILANNIVRENQTAGQVALRHTEMALVSIVRAELKTALSQDTVVSKYDRVDGIGSPSLTKKSLSGILSYHVSNFLVEFAVAVVLSNPLP